jgi:site-specific recombinase XerD
MELYVVYDKGKTVIALLDDEMRIIKPVYDYLKFQKQRDRAVNTLKANGYDLKLFWEFLNANGYEYDEITPNMIAEFIDYLRAGDSDGLYLFKESERTNRTINRTLSTLHGFYKYMANMREIDNPMLMHDINRPFNMFKSILHHARSDNKVKQSIFKLKESDRSVRLVTDNEVELFLSRLTKRRDILLYKVLYLTGARIQEVLDLEIESIPVPDISESIGIFQQIKSKGKHRNLYVPMSLIVELDDFILGERSLIDTDHSFIFVSEQKKQLGKQLTYSAAYDKLKKMQSEMGIRFNFHDLRHTLCSNLVQIGMDISIIKIIMGHEHISTTQRYTHLSDPYIMESLSKYWGQSTVAGGIPIDK